MMTIEIQMPDDDVTLDEAREIAAEAAAMARGVPTADLRIMAWYDQRSGRLSPEVGCGDDFVTVWEDYAIDRGADLKVELNGGHYIFLCGTHLHH